MCLLVVVSRVDREVPLVLAGNRDERYERPARPRAVLRAGGPRIVGGRDELAGGTWLAVNEHGVVAGLTNRPSPEGVRDPTKRSRGELPLALATHPDAERAVANFSTTVSADDYNPCWLLVADRRSLFYVDMTGAGRPRVEPLGPGVHVLENSALGYPTAKTTRVRRRIVPLAERGAAHLLRELPAVLGDHTVAEGDTEGNAGGSAMPGAAGEGEGSGGGAANANANGVSRPRPPELSASCVHTEGYGTRSSMMVAVPASEDLLPRVWIAEGPPCTAPFVALEDLTATR